MLIHIRCIYYEILYFFVKQSQTPKTIIVVSQH